MSAMQLATVDGTCRASSASPWHRVFGTSNTKLSLAQLSCTFMITGPAIFALLSPKYIYCTNPLIGLGV
jgi:hypothetical protein